MIQPVSTPEPELVDVTINNVTVKVPKEKAEEVKNFEHNLSSGLRTKYEQQVEELKRTKSEQEQAIESERQRVATALRDDMNWLSTHPQEAWAGYNLKVQGGDGSYVGDPEALVDPTGTAIASSTTKPLKNDPVLDKLNEVNKKLQEFDNKLIAQDSRAAVDYMKTQTQLEQYNYADTNAVSNRMWTYFLENGKVAPIEKINEYLEQSHKHVVSIRQREDAVTKDKNAPVINVTGAPPNLEQFGPRPKMTFNNVGELVKYGAKVLGSKG